MTLYFQLEYNSDLDRYLLQSISLDPRFLKTSNGPIYYSEWDSKNSSFDTFNLEADVEPWDYFKVWEGIVKKEVALDDSFESWKQFSDAVDLYEKETGEVMDWYVSWYETYEKGKLIKSDRPDVEGIINKLHEYIN